MKTIITGRKVNLKDSFKERIEKKISKFDRMFPDGAVATVTATIEKENEREKVEVTIKHNSEVYRAECTTSDLEESLDRVMDMLTKQFRKHKTRLSKKLRGDFIENYIPELVDNKDIVEELEYDLVREKHFPVVRLSTDEAIFEMNMIGHQFYMFRNKDTGEVNVVYRRRNGDYGLLEPNVE